jgi:3',5'-cyclic AMP phosphodiesterase CpdA/tetratricopeptide (TPR) repeat protein
MKRLFVIMPFGLRRADERHDVDSIDFDFVYNDLIRPAAKAAEFEPVRIDELVEPGQITHQYLREILEADLVLAEISLPNANVYYELGIRQAISTGGTILIALEKSAIPFDLANQRVFFYNPSLQNLEKVRQTLIEALSSQRAKPTENPVRSFLEQIRAVASPEADRDAFEQDLQGRISRAQNSEQLIAVWRWARNLSPLPPFTLLSLARRLSDFGEWSHSVEVLKAAVALRSSDFELHRELGWHLSKLGLDYSDDAIGSFESALALNPDDPEALGMLAGVFKRKGNFKQASEYYSKGAEIAPSNLYMLVNQAAMELFLAPDNPIQGISLYHKLKEKILNSLQDQGSLDEWQEVVLGEAMFVIGELRSAKTHFLAANRLAASPKSLRSAADQLELLGKAGFKSEEALHLAEWLRSIADETIQLGEVLNSHPEEALPDDKLPVLLHLSDLHFGRVTREDGRSRDMHRFYDGEYSKRLSRHVVDEFTARRAHFTHEASRVHILISGDITYTAQPDEFRLAQGFLREVCEGLNISRDRIYIVPGNHDVDWQLGKVNLSHRFDNYIQFLVEFYGEELFRAKHPNITWDLRINTKRPEPWEILSIQHNPDAGLMIVGLNSCVYETHQDHYGLIGGRQLGIVEELLDDSSSAHIRVALFHHHLHPFPEFIQTDPKAEVGMDLSIIRDSGIVERQLERMKFDLVLHGHKHKPQIRETVIKTVGNTGPESAKLIVCGAGSVGVNAVELEHNVSNQYQVIEVLRSPRKRAVDFLRVEWRTLEVSPEADWTTPGTWIISG